MNEKQDADFKRARGIFHPTPGDELPEDAVRRVRGDCDALAEETRDDKIAELRANISACRKTLLHQQKIIKRLKEDGERLVNTLVFEVYGNEYVNPLYACAECGNNGESKDFEHVTGCPVTLHRALMKELE